MPPRCVHRGRGPTPPLPHAAALGKGTHGAAAKDAALALHAQAHAAPVVATDARALHDTTHPISNARTDARAGPDAATDAAAIP